MRKHPKIFIMIPTYNERGNIALLIKEIFSLKIPNLEIVVVDDNSPDRTWEVVKDISKKNKKVHLLHRTRNRGRGLAGVAGFKYALEHGADYIMEMDADFSHQPRHIPELLKTAERYPVVLGSRSVKGGRDIGRTLFRRLVTFLSNLFIRIIFGISIQDPNSGFRCFRREVLEKVDLDTIRSRDADIVQELLYKCHQKGFKIKEIPIRFRDRLHGETTKDWRDYVKGIRVVLRLRLNTLFGN